MLRRHPWLTQSLDLLLEWVSYQLVGLSSRRRFLFGFLRAGQNPPADDLCLFDALCHEIPCFHPPQMSHSACVFFLRQHLYPPGSAALVQLPPQVSVSYPEPCRASEIVSAAPRPRHRELLACPVAATSLEWGRVF